MESEGLRWDDPWLQSLDLEYHNIDPEKGLFFGVNPAKRIGEWNNSVRRNEASYHPPMNTRAAGRAQAVAWFKKSDQPYVINWDSIACDNRDFLVMGNPFEDYTAEVARFLAQPRSSPGRGRDAGEATRMED
jgi:proteasome accessory factor A